MLVRLIEFQMCVLLSWNPVYLFLPNTRYGRARRCWQTLPSFFTFLSRVSQYRRTLENITNTRKWLSADQSKKESCISSCFTKDARKNNQENVIKINIKLFAISDKRNKFNIISIINI